MRLWPAAALKSIFVYLFLIAFKLPMKAAAEIVLTWKFLVSRFKSFKNIWVKAVVFDLTNLSDWISFHNIRQHSVYISILFYFRCVSLLSRCQICKCKFGWLFWFTKPSMLCSNGKHTDEILSHFWALFQYSVEKAE